MVPKLEPATAELAGKRLSARARVANVEVFSALDDLPAPYLRLFEEAGRPHFFLSLPWFRNFVDTALDEDSRLRIYGIRHGAGMFLARSSPPGRNLCAATNFYSCFFALHTGACEDAEMTLKSLAEAIQNERPRWDTVEIQPLDVNSEAFASLAGAFRRAGFIVQTFFCFGNWYLPVNGRSFAEYVDSLPSVLKNTLSRKRKKLEKSGRGTVQIITGGEGLDAAIEAYTRVYLASGSGRSRIRISFPG